MAEVTPGCDFGWKAPDFSLLATDGQTYNLEQIRGKNGTLIMFICNHCPFVKGIVDRLVDDINALKEHGIESVAICSNDAISHPADSFDNMKLFASQNTFSFPYLHDDDQSVAKAYGAVCTPDFFGFNADLALQYRGRLDSAGKNAATPETPRELLGAMIMIAQTGNGPTDQNPSMGCSIKWKSSVA